MIPVRLIATGKAVPVHSVTSASLDVKLGHPPGYTLRKSGVLSRFVAAPDESQSQLGAAALLFLALTALYQRQRHWAMFAALCLVAALLLFISGIILSSQLAKDARDFEFQLQTVHH